jgi:hypothetical protein
MKAERFKTPETTEEVSLQGAENRVARHKCQPSAPFARKTEGGLQKWLANLWSGKKITKKVHAGRGQETKWEIPAKC